ncbi:hypothetical protein FACS1894113_4420 [Alphaproteobacteria bacterium]|nr:hypothetical protein FACS1894113_4420 [Alphaproteobacteria bacterium]
MIKHNVPSCCIFIIKPRTNSGKVGAITLFNMKSEILYKYSLILSQMLDFNIEHKSAIDTAASSEILFSINGLMFKVQAGASKVTGSNFETLTIPDANIGFAQI